MVLQHEVNYHYFHIFQVTSEANIYEFLSPINSRIIKHRLIEEKVIHFDFKDLSSAIFILPKMWPVNRTT